MKHFVLVALILCGGCSVRHPTTRNWRLVKQTSGHRLVPPDVLKADIPHRILKASIRRGKGTCNSLDGILGINSRGKQIQVKVFPTSLAAQPTGWLGRWAAVLEERECVAPGEGMKLASRVSESVPMNPRDAFRLLYSDDKETGEVDLHSKIRLQVVSPLWRKEGVGLMADGAYSVAAGRGYNLTVTGTSTDNLIGYETAIYALQPASNSLGSLIVPLYSDQSIQGKVERMIKPGANYFPVSSTGRFYRLFYKSGQNDFTAILIGAGTPTELSHLTKAMHASSSATPCATLSEEMCLIIPKTVAINTLITVTVNQAEVLLPRGATLFQAIRRTGQIQPNEVLPELTVIKPWNGILTRVEFDRTDPAILRLVLGGGEVVSWR